MQRRSWRFALGAVAALSVAGIVGTYLVADPHREKNDAAHAEASAPRLDAKRPRVHSRRYVDVRVGVSKPSATPDAHESEAAASLPSSAVGTFGSREHASSTPPSIRAVQLAERGAALLRPSELVRRLDAASPLGDDARARVEGVVHLASSIQPGIDSMGDEHERRQAQAGLVRQVVMRLALVTDGEHQTVIEQNLGAQTRFESDS